MKKLTMIYKDGSKFIAKMKNETDHMKYFNQRISHRIKSAILQVYPVKDNRPIDLLKDTEWEDKK